MGKTIKIEGKDFEIVGILEKSGNPMFNSMIVMNDGVMRELLDIENEVDIITLKIKSSDEMKQVEDAVAKVMRKERGVAEGKEDFEIQTPAQLLESFGSILSVVKVVLVGIAAISLIVGGIGIMNTMYTAVLERRKEIGIMKSIGAKNSDIMLLFLIEAGFIGLVGGLMGVLIGASLSKAVEFGAGVMLGPNLVKANFTFFLIAGALLFSFLVGTISGTLPAMQAAKLKPVDALRL